ncbi:MAG: cache domain-containing protein, partial [Chloroflexota bacterium]
MHIRPISRWFTPQNWSLRAQFTSAMIILVTFFLSVMTYVTITEVRSTLTRQIGENFEAQAVSLNDLIGGFFLEKVGQLQVLTLSLVIQDMVIAQNASYTGSQAEILAEILVLDEAWRGADDDAPLIFNTITHDPEINAVTHRLASFLESFPDHSEVFVTDQYGATVAATGRLSDYYQADETWWQEAWQEGQGAVYISKPEYDDSAGVTALLIAVPLYDKETNKIIGVLRSTLVVDELFSLMGRVVFGETGRALLLDDTGNVLFDSLATDADSIGFTGHLEQHFIENLTGFTIATSPTGRQSLFGHSQFLVQDFAAATTFLEKQIIQAVTDLGWVTVVEQETTEAFASANQVRQIVLIVGLVIIILVSLTVFFLARNFVRPLLTLSRAAEHIGRGKLNTPLPQVGSYEVSRLTASFQQMADQLQQSFQTLEEHNRVLSLARDNALEANRLKTQLLARVSHELRTPLGAIVGYAGVLQEGIFGPLTDDQLAQLNPIVTNSEALRVQIDSLLDQAQLENGKMTLEITAFTPADLIANVEATVRPMATAENLSLKSQIDPSLPTTISSDFHRLQEILRNLVSNAIKFTSEGLVQIRLYKANEDLWALEVSDTGAGIPAQEQADIFQPFHQVDGSATRKHGGVGLGLSMTWLKQSCWSPWMKLAMSL